MRSHYRTHARREGLANEEIEDVIKAMVAANTR